MLVDARPAGIRGFLIDASSPGRLRRIRDGALLVEEGRIAACDTYEAVRAAHATLDIRWMHSPEAVVIPGLVDLRSHLAQYPAVARHATDAASWRRKHVAPLEKQFKAAAARSQAPAFYEDLARHGTTCAMVSGPCFDDSTEAAFSAAEESGMRIILGRTMADVPGKTPEQNIAGSESLCRKWHGRAGGRLEYVFSISSAGSCSGELMKRAAELAQKHGACIQAPLAESAGAGETALYADCGLLGPRTILGHCIHLSDAEIAQAASAGSAVAHCPTSDFFLTSGLMPVDRLRAAGLRIGLGSGVAGGPELNMWQVMRSAIEAQKARHFHDSSVPVPGVADVFYLATAGGASALGKESRIGAFEIGSEADVVVLDLAGITPYGRKLNPHASLSAEDVISLLVYRGGPAAVVETFVRGRSVYRAPTPNLV